MEYTYTDGYQDGYAYEVAQETGDTITFPVFGPDDPTTEYERGFAHGRSARRDDLRNRR